jgi:hypothetical protein
MIPSFFLVKNIGIVRFYFEDWDLFGICGFEFCAFRSFAFSLGKG